MGGRSQGRVVAVTLVGKSERLEAKGTKNIAKL